MSGVTPDQLMNGIVVVLAILAAIVAVDKFIDVIKKWKAPEKTITEKLSADKRELEQHEKEIRALKDGQRALCTGVMALLDHQLHNGNTGQMEDAKKDIDKYLKNLI